MPSALAAKFLFQLRALGLPEPVHELSFHPARKWKFDFAYPEKRLAFEVEGGLWVNGRHNRAVDKDIEKYTAAALLDWFVYRVTPEAIRDGRGARWAHKFMQGWRTSGHGNTVPLPVRFWSKVERKAPRECWLWQGRRDDKGYGEFQFNGRKIKAAWMALSLSGVECLLPLVMHSCDNPPCCNPAHLRPGTHAENAQDRDSKGRGRYYAQEARRDERGRVVPRAS